MAAVLPPPLAPPPSDVLPSYTRRDPRISNAPTAAPTAREQRRHTRHLVKNGRNWLTLSFQSPANDSGDPELPHFSQTTPISGSVHLRLPGEAVVRSVSVSVIGELSSPTHYVRFLTVTRQLFVSDASDLDRSLPDPPDIFEGKLSGEHVWPFSIQLPKGVSILFGTSISARHNFRLPPTLTNAMSKARIQYKLVVRVKKGILSTDNRLTADFVYTPLLRPAQPSILRQIACLENQPLIGPDGDPDGWRCLRPLTLRGKIFNARSIEATCVKVAYQVSLFLFNAKLSIARPVCYTRGTTIPLVLSISSSDTQALDLLSLPSAPTCQLMRHATFSMHVDSTSLEVISSNSREWFPEVIGTAVWRQAFEDTGNSPHRRILHGDIVIPADTPPSCNIVNFHLQYTITLVDIKAVAFTPSAESRRTPMHSELVPIVTVPAPGPLEASSLPPMYESVSA
ncbi:hypothetical protein BXZ70DRAFT_1064411 [Cristinia sonorae]|uniref:Arrestin-like N-terminal domain-containing protein n=1 Tax=Cristinia sonorae TaxID=1940300 RepID=A0A8K0UNR3_9AGAR|nr:hypothetical protein BXZ70DRAFT_1064411 [Cristinia sonorae]